MSKNKKIILGLATIFPLVYMVFFFVFVFSQIFKGIASNEPFGSFLLLILFHMFTMLLMFVLIIIYIINVFKNDRVDKEKKALWAVVLFLGGMIAMPIYWYLYIWKDDTKSQ